ncbi:tRNA (adenosine(37)-N6)-threonylcarbamoyltransferase complex dimerization subunit type 1 TsaB [Flavobacterium sp.]|uniref:tRNA (adenosine(37)-N6)-threonylcarbamoyltransferase complex dimerization subunit type 1 TsaB n=1 Tax=Flavobacterium sp. TaxID=239 RepID=UPI002616F2CF|nr:tRNA (adenosine(37)-N6)-threonylcarbamoyltransferase complex dimerization subunit type 1 TsaB [Flavobacterium sp.]
MALILCLETATKNCSVALSKDGAFLAAKEFAGENYSQAELLHLFIQDVLDEANLAFSDLNAVAVSAGPGSYTGLRIGVAAAKGLCYALDIPLLSVSTLEILATAKQITSGYKVPMLDARRMEVYTAVYDTNNQLIEAVSAKILDEQSFDTYNETLFLFGDGAHKCKELFANRTNIIIDESLPYPSAKDMLALAHKRFTNGDFEDVAYFEPFYLKDFIVGGGK